jgi:hypothetical protein
MSDEVKVAMGKQANVDRTRQCLSRLDGCHISGGVKESTHKHDIILRLHQNLRYVEPHSSAIFVAP